MNPEDFAHIAELLRRYIRNGHEDAASAVLSNNLAIILAALDIAAGGVPAVAGETHPSAARNDTRCPNCHLNWWLFPPAHIHGLPMIRCVECKRVYDEATGSEVDAG